MGWLVSKLPILFCTSFPPNKKAKLPLKGNSAYCVKTVCISPTFPQDVHCSVLNFPNKFIYNFSHLEIVFFVPKLINSCQLYYSCLAYPANSWKYQLSKTTEIWIKNHNEHFNENIITRSTICRFKALQREIMDLIWRI